MPACSIARLLIYSLTSLSPKRKWPQSLHIPDIHTVDSHEYFARFWCASKYVPGGDLHVTRAVCCSVPVIQDLEQTPIVFVLLSVLCTLFHTLYGMQWSHDAEPDIS